MDPKVPESLEPVDAEDTSPALPKVENELSQHDEIFLDGSRDTVIDVHSGQIRNRVERQLFLHLPSKRTRFVEMVIHPNATELLQQDNKAAVLIAGSYSASEDSSRLRDKSDIDIIVLSEKLVSPLDYYSYLVTLRASTNEYSNKTGFVPFWFTQIAREEALRYIAGKHFDTFIKEKSNLSRDQVLLPLHFLYYPNQHFMLGREPQKLASRLFNKCKIVVGTKNAYHDSDNSKPLVMPKDEEFDKARWSLERALAELVLNFGNLPYEYIVTEYNNIIRHALRGVLGDYFFGSEVNPTMDKVLEKFENSDRLKTLMAPIEDIHENGVEHIKYKITDLAKPVIEVLKAIDDLTAKTS